MKNLKTIITLFILVLIASCSKDNEALAPAVNPVAISSMGPTTGAKNTAVVLIGTGFSNNAASNIVTLNGKVCTVNQASTTQLNITIPPKSSTGNIIVTVAGNSAQSTPFTYIDTVTVSTLAGSTLGNADGQGVNAQFNTPFGIAIDGTRTLFIADTRNHRIRKISPTGLVTTIAGSIAGFADGQGAAAQLNLPSHLVQNATGDLFVTDKENHKIRKISNTGQVENYAGTSKGFEVKARQVSKFDSPFGIVTNILGEIIVVDSKNFRIRNVPNIGGTNSVAGNSNAGITDGQGTAAQFTNPEGIEIDAAGNLYVADDGISKLIRKISTTGLVTTLAGGPAGFADGQGADARFSDVTDIAIDATGNLFVTDKHRIRKISPTGLVTTIAGSDTAGFADGDATTAQFNVTAGIAIDLNGNLYVADSRNNRIRKITID